LDVVKQKGTNAQKLGILLLWNNILYLNLNTVLYIKFCPFCGLDPFCLITSNFSVSNKEFAYFYNNFQGLFQIAPEQPDLKVQFGHSRRWNFSNYRQRTLAAVFPKVWIVESTHLFLFQWNRTRQTEVLNQSIFCE
jgi:hypothetical protein